MENKKITRTGATSVDVRASKSTAEWEAKRDDSHMKFDYTRKDLRSKNECWETPGMTRASVIKAAKERYVNHVHQKPQKNYAPHRNIVVVIKENTTIKQLQNFAKAVNDEFGVNIYAGYIHRDEGRWVKDDPEGLEGLTTVSRKGAYEPKKGEYWKPNYHAHLFADWTDKVTGKSIRLKPSDMSRIQDLAAQCLGMDRGYKKDPKNKAKRLEALEYKLEKAKTELAIVESKKERESKEADENEERKEKTNQDIEKGEKHLQEINDEIKNKSSLLSKGKAVIDRISNESARKKAESARKKAEAAQKSAEENEAAERAARIAAEKKVDQANADAEEKIRLNNEENDKKLNAAKEEAARAIKDANDKEARLNEEKKDLDARLKKEYDNGYQKGLKEGKQRQQTINDRAIKEANDKIGQLSQQNETLTKDNNAFKETLEKYKLWLQNWKNFVKRLMRVWIKDLFVREDTIEQQQTQYDWEYYYSHKNNYHTNDPEIPQLKNIKVIGSMWREAINENARYFKINDDSTIKKIRNRPEEVQEEKTSKKSRGMHL